MSGYCHRWPRLASIIVLVSHACADSIVPTSSLSCLCPSLLCRVVLALSVLAPLLHPPRLADPIVAKGYHQLWQQRMPANFPLHDEAKPVRQLHHGNYRHCRSSSSSSSYRRRWNINNISPSIDSDRHGDNCYDEQGLAFVVVMSRCAAAVAPTLIVSSSIFFLFKFGPRRRWRPRWRWWSPWTPREQRMMGLVGMCRNKCKILH